MSHDDHSHGHHHHDHAHGDANGHHHGYGHNHSHAGAGHLHSHPTGGAAREAEGLKALMAAFIEGFRAAADKPSHLKLAGIPQSRTGPDGLAMHLVDVSIETRWQMGTASPAFASRELVHLPYPAKMVTEREEMHFTYVSLTYRADVPLQELLAGRT
jgi:hypothetical protein